MVSIYENDNSNSFLSNRKQGKWHWEYLSNRGDVLQGHGMKGLILALEEELQGWKQKVLVQQQRAQLLHTLKHKHVCEQECKEAFRMPRAILPVPF